MSLSPLKAIRNSSWSNEHMPEACGGFAKVLVEALQYGQGHSEQTRCRHINTALGRTAVPPSPGPNTGLSKHSDPMFPHFWVFWNLRFCGFNPIEKVICSVVQAAGRVNMGVKVFV